MRSTGVQHLAAMHRPTTWHLLASLVPRLYPCARTQTIQKCNESEVAFLIGLSTSARVKPGNEANTSLESSPFTTSLDLQNFGWFFM